MDLEWHQLEPKDVKEFLRKLQQCLAVGISAEPTLQPTINTSARFINIGVSSNSYIAVRQQGKYLLGILFLNLQLFFICGELELFSLKI